ncbi:MAG: transglutaminase family protein [Halieaceae bacterium]
MRIRATCDIAMHLEVETPLILMLRPRAGDSQRISSESYGFSHEVPVVEYTDMFGNFCQRLVAPAVEFSIHSVVEAETAATMAVAPGAPFILVQDLPLDVLGYLVPTRYCESDRLGDITRQAIGNTLSGYDQVAIISDWVRQHVSYRPGTGDTLLSADEVRRQGYGVCRDLAHVGIAMCRSVSIPARMVVGYLAGLEPMDLHAWFEAWVGGRWYTFDPTQECLESPRLAIAVGRDAADVAIYHQFGPLPITSSAHVSVSLVGDA